MHISVIIHPYTLPSISLNINVLSFNVTGECALIDEIMVGEDKLIRFSGCKSGTACTVILRGASSHLLGTTLLLFGSSVLGCLYFTCG